MTYEKNAFNSLLVTQLKKKSITEQPYLSNLVQMDEKHPRMQKKEKKNTIISKISMKIVIFIEYDNNSSTEVYW